MTGKVEKGLNEFEIPVVPSSNLLGIYMAVHAIPDAVNLTHVPVGCKPKIMNLMANHEGLDKNFYRNRWTNISGVDIIRGSEERLEHFIRECYGRYNQPGVMVVTTNMVIELAACDMNAGVANAEKDVDARLLHMKTRDFDGDIYDGYSDVVAQLASGLDWAEATVEPKTVNIIGYVYDRKEYEHSANVDELTRMLSALSIDTKSVFLSNRKWEKLKQAPGAAHNVILPHMGNKLAELEKQSGRPTIDTTLPLGLAPTVRWLEQIAEGIGIEPEAVENYVAAEQQRLAPALRYARERLHGLELAIFSDTVTAAHMSVLATELGMDVVLVGLTDRTLGGNRRFRSILESFDVALRDEAEVLENPPLQQLARNEESAGEVPPFDMIIRPTFDFFPETVPVLEMGFPSRFAHTVYPLPTYGLNGVGVMCQRLTDACSRPRIEGWKRAKQRRKRNAP